MVQEKQVDEIESLQKFFEKNNCIEFQSFKILSEHDDTRGIYTDVMYPRERTMPISKNNFLIGHHFTNPFPPYSRGGRFTIDFGSEVIRLLMFGRTRSGKTMQIRRIFDFAHLNHYHCVAMTDIKNEMRSSKQPQSKFAHLLDPNDISTAIPMKIYRPEFFKYFLNETRCPNDNEYFTLSYKRLNYNDIFKLLGIANIAKKEAQNVVSLYCSSVDSFDELKHRIQNATDVKKNVKNTILAAIEPLLQYKLFTKEDSHNFIKDMLTHTVVFNVKDYDRVTEGNLNIVPQIYFKLILQAICDAKEKKMLPNRVMLSIDEAPLFLASDTISEKELRHIVERQTYLGIYALFAAQDIKKAPSWLVNQCRYIFFPHNIDYETFKDMLAAVDNYGWHPSFKKELMEIKKTMKKKANGERMWGVIDTVDKRVILYWSYPSLSEHLESDK